MKTKKLIFLFFSILCLLSAKMYAQGTSCSTATALSGKGTYADFVFQPQTNAAWFSFVATSARMDVQIDRPILAVDTPFVHIDSLILYSGTCNNLTQLQYSKKHDTALYDSLPDVQALNLTPGQTYYVKATRVLQPDDQSKPFFALNQTYLVSALIPNCAQGLCGPNLLCNGDFENVPTWATPTVTPTMYADASYTFPQTPVAAPELGYCISSPNMRYNGNNFGGSPGTCSEPDRDYTDIYSIAKSMFGNVAHSGSYFMGIDCPSDNCYECSAASNHYCVTPTLVTTNYTCTAWKETVTVVPGTLYTFEGWIKSIDPAGYPGATVTITINGAAPFFQDVIDPIHYGVWTHFCYNWTAPTGVTSAVLQIFGQGTFDPSGYDFGIDNLAFGTSSPFALNQISLNSPTICAGTSTPLIATPPTTGATYTWSTGVTTTTNSITVSPTVTTTYSVTEFGGKCQSTAIGIVTVDHPTITVSSTATCLGACNGTATATATNGIAPYSYSWSPGGQTTTSVSGLCAGVHTVTVTDAHGCISTATVNISTTVPPVINVTSTTICPGSSGTICASGASSFSWSTTPVATTACITESPAVTTTYTVTGSNGTCTATATGTITVDPVPLICLPAYTQICPGSCTNLEAACKKIPQAGITYTWAPATGLSATTGALVTACPMVNTTYTVTATNTVTGCHATATEVVNLYPVPTIVMSESPACRGLCNGTATATVTSGTGPYTYSWAPGSQTTASISGLCPGNYTVSVTDGHGCVTTGVIRVLAEALPIVHASSTTICDGSSGTICASGTATNYTWSTTPIATTTCITESPTTTTTYTVTGSNGLCSATATGTITVNPTPHICLADSVTICPSSCTTLEAACRNTPQPGVVYTWAPATGLSATTGVAVTACPTVNTVYTVTATNTVTGCSATATEVVTLYPAPHIIISSSFVCAGSCNGTATANVTGAAPFTYSWAPGGQTTASIGGLCAGTYSLSVTDAHGCVTKTSVTISSLPLPIVNATSATVCAGNSATICASGNALTYVWNPTGASTACITVSPTVTTTYTVTGHNLHCSASATATVTVEPLPVVTATATPTCGKTCSGTATATVTGGLAPYTYHWATGGYTTAHVTGLCGGNYTVTVTDAHGCTGSAVVNVPYIFPPAITATSATVCYGSSATICASGASGYVWSPTGATTACITVTPTVTTTYTVTGSNGVNGSCSATATATVTVDHPTVTTTSTPSCLKYCNGTASATATGGSAPYTYSWTPGAQTTASISGLCGGNYTVTVTDAHGCTSNTVASVSILSPPVITVTSATVCAGSSAIICASGASNYVWSPSGATTACITVSPTATTTYTVTGSNGVNGSCAATGNGTVTVNQAPQVCTKDSVLVCPKQCTTLNALCNGAVLPNVTYTWSPATYITSGANTAQPTVCPQSNIIYTVTATNTLTGCSATGTTSVFVFPTNYVIHGPTSVVCGSTNTYSVTPALPNPPVISTWTVTNGTPSTGTGTTANVVFNSPGGTISWLISYNENAEGQGCETKVTLTVQCGSNGTTLEGTTGNMNSLTDNNVRVYPNPAGEVVNVQMVLQPNEQLNMCMYNNLGEQIKCETLTENISHISTSMLPAGIYFYRITNSDGTLVKSDKIMIVH